MIRYRSTCRKLAASELEVVMARCGAPGFRDASLFLLSAAVLEVNGRQHRGGLGWRGKLMLK